MKLVRARPKRVEDLPEWARCCDECLAELVDIGDVVVDTLTCEPSESRICWYCNAEGPSGTLVAVVGDDFWVRMELLDLDEGEYAGVTR